MALATPSDMIARYDERSIADLLSDTGDPVESADLATDTKLLAALESASGRVEAAVLVSNNYTAAELAGLTGNSLALLKDIVCDIAMARLLRRRPEKIGEDSLASIAKESEDYLDRLRNGDRLFDVPAHREAGTPSVDGPTAVDYQNLNLIPDRTKHFYPRRSGRLPIGR
jgi:phage gp36-like protein